MIKGHMTIELADAKTGKVVEKHEDDNLVTNGVKHYFKNMGMLNYTPFDGNTGQIIQAHNNNFAIPFFGGLMLFDTAQEENAEHIFVSGGTKMTGNGINGYTSNDSVTEFGSYNSEESGWQSDGSFKQVWDFTTTQANGTIACACLCPFNYGAMGEGNSTSKVRKTSSSGMSASSTDVYAYVGARYDNKQIAPSGSTLLGVNGYEEYPLYINTEENYAIILYYKAGATPLDCKAVKVFFPWNKFDIRDGLLNGGRVLSEVQNITLPSQVTSGNNFMSRPQTIVGRDDEGAFYFAVNTISYNSNYFNAQNPVHIIKFVIGANDIVTCEYVMSLTPSLIGETTGNWYYGSPHVLRLVNKNLFLATGTNPYTLDHTKWFKINTETQVVESVTDNTSSDFTNFGNSINLLPIPDSNSIYSYNSYVKIDLTAKEVTSMNTNDNNGRSTGAYGLIDNKCALYMHDGVSINSILAGIVYRYTHFLSTINNLESPVVKTSDKTMKITYVLRFDET